MTFLSLELLGENVHGRMGDFKKSPFGGMSITNERHFSSNPESFYHDDVRVIFSRIFERLQQTLFDDTSKANVCLEQKKKFGGGGGGDDRTTLENANIGPCFNFSSVVVVYRNT